MAACARLVREAGNGVCIRIQREDFDEFPDLKFEISRVLAATGAKHETADLLLDCRALTPEARYLTADATLGLISQMPDLSRWRTFTLAATAFPENLMGLPPSDCSLLPRLEWNLWREVARKGRRRRPWYGDYAISHPEPSEVDPRIMRPSASVRYTVDEAWLVLKARNLRDHGYEQFHSVCRDLVRRPEYSGRNFSWGDGYIDDCANESVGTGNLTTWRKVGTSHHLAKVLRQLSSVRGT